MILMTDDNIELASISEHPFVIGAPQHAASNRSALERVRLACIDQRESLFASLHILRTVGGLAWRREIARRRILGWARAFFGAWYSRKLRRIVSDSGFGFRAPGPRRMISDQDGSSMLILLEDDLPLAAPHTVHDEIRRLGRGRYSHWGRCIYFSTSDNTDPRNNGRVYKLAQRM
jgi:hypothetical protein